MILQQHAARAGLQCVCPFVVADWEGDNAAVRACGVAAHAYWDVCCWKGITELELDMVCHCSPTSDFDVCDQIEITG